MKLHISMWCLFWIQPRFNAFFFKKDTTVLKRFLFVSDAAKLQCIDIQCVFLAADIYKLCTDTHTAVCFYGEARLDFNLCVFYPSMSNSDCFSLLWVFFCFSFATGQASQWTLPRKTLWIKKNIGFLFATIFAVTNSMQPIFFYTNQPTYWLRLHNHKRIDDFHVES